MVVFANLVLKALKEAVLNDNALPPSQALSVAESDSTSMAVHRVLGSLALMLKQKGLTTNTHYAAPLCRLLVVSTTLLGPSAAITRLPGPDLNLGLGVPSSCNHHS